MTPRKRRGPQDPTNWEAIEADFVENPNRKLVSARKLAKKYGFDKSTISRHSIKDHWDEKIAKMPGKTSAP